MNLKWPFLVFAGVLVVVPFHSHAADGNSAGVETPQRLIVDTETAPTVTVSVQDAPHLVDIVLVPEGEYIPVHPDTLDGEHAVALMDNGTGTHDAP